MLTQNFKNIFENYFECFGKICRIVGKRGKIDEKIIDFDKCFNNVDFPHPLGPMMAVILLVGNSTDISCNTDRVG